MFICDNCIVPEIKNMAGVMMAAQSYGPCEYCHKMAVCRDIPCSHLTAMENEAKKNE